MPGKKRENAMSEYLKFLKFSSKFIILVALFLSTFTTGSSTRAASQLDLQYIDPQFGFMVAYPSAWKLDSGKVVDPYTYVWEARFVAPIPDAYVAFVVSVASLPGEMTSQEWANRVIISNGLNRAELESAGQLGESTIDGEPAVMITLPNKAGALTLFSRNGFGYILSLEQEPYVRSEVIALTPAVLDENFATYAEILANFKIGSLVPTIQSEGLMLAQTAPEIASNFQLPATSNWTFGYESHPTFWNGIYSSCFQVEKQNLFHAGVDLGSSLGTGVFAIANGQVYYYDSAYSNYPGKVLVLMHLLPNGSTVYSFYGHLGSVDVAAGQNVSKGTRLGTMLDQGTNTHLHWEVRYNGNMGNIYVNPACNVSWAPGPGYTYPEKPDFYGYTNPLNFINSKTTVPTPVSPKGTITDTTPSFSWSKIDSATQYQYSLYKGSTLVYTNLVDASACGSATNCVNTPATVLGAGTYSWKAQAMVAGSWNTFSASLSFILPSSTLATVAPSGTITDTTPSYSWTRLMGATQYQYQLLKGTSVIYTKSVLASACGSGTNCVNTPTTVLTNGVYTWKVRAMVKGVWSAYTGVKSFTFPTVPTLRQVIGAITDSTPTYIWSKVLSASQYQLVLLKDGVSYYTKSVASSSCGSTANCVYTPTTELPDGAYTWKVRAMVSGVWKTFSGVKSFTLTTTPVVQVTPGEMVAVPEGSFQMGCDPTHNDGVVCDADELPLHTVFLSAYQIDKYEVTNGQYAECVSVGACVAPSSASSRTQTSYFGNPTFANYPVIFVSWYDAANYCAWVGKRLPTEAEWEKAARGTTVRAFPWGDTTPSCSLTNYNYSCSEDTTAVGSFTAGVSPYGALDMAGNVWEWVSDWYKSDYYSSSPATDPTGPSTGTLKVRRGGAGSYVHDYLLTTDRGKPDPDLENEIGGFRCAKEGFK